MELSYSTRALVCGGNQPIHQSLRIMSNTSSPVVLRHRDSGSTRPHQNGQCGCQSPHQQTGQVLLLSSSQRGASTIQLGRRTPGGHSHGTHIRYRQHSGELAQQRGCLTRRVGSALQHLRHASGCFRTPQVDFFTMYKNRQVPRFFAKYLHPEAEGLDSLTACTPALPFPYFHGYSGRFNSKRRQ